MFNLHSASTNKFNVHLLTLQSFHIQLPPVGAFVYLGKLTKLDLRAKFRARAGSEDGRRTKRVIKILLPT